jgi:competence protein ComGC
VCDRAMKQLQLFLAIIPLLMLATIPNVSAPIKKKNKRDCMVLI